MSERVVPKFLSVPVIEDQTGLSKNTLRRAIARGELKVHRFGRAVKVSAEDLARWLESKRAAR